MPLLRLMLRSLPLLSLMCEKNVNGVCSIGSRDSVSRSLSCSDRRCRLLDGIPTYRCSAHVHLAKHDKIRLCSPIDSVQGKSLRYRWSWHPALIDGFKTMFAGLLDGTLRLMIFLLSIGSTATTTASIVLFEHKNWSVLRIATLSIETHGFEFQDFRIPVPNATPHSRNSAGVDFFCETNTQFECFSFRRVFHGNVLGIGTHRLVRVVVADEYLLHQYILLWLVQTSEIADQL